MDSQNPKDVKRKRLTAKQEKFAAEYAKTGNGTQAALKVYNTTDTKTASVIAAENLAKPSIQRRVSGYLDCAIASTVDIINTEGIAQALLRNLHKLSNHTNPEIALKASKQLQDLLQWVQSPDKTTIQDNRKVTFKYPKF